ncbi:TetR/AcrR family transcriptional regulator [Antarcticibacterium flavum]|uniref:TetR/AcrR family transcriptional regulator n=1 Tax=Antarcticibacterium flavum TaxID=2058175 RepID=A0A5B7X7S1_9FLAO|nr:MULTISPECIES: TetR family transcriptional regulator C-terminal domain-containing protein [Antarcticibacterium]MCM4159762.1 heat-shock protein [Antarcticibacterium sp. W02-3]QCY70693.1 TetR/AcrR family transcriptional regulator [Antarcticibacterium flavum]
MAKQKTTAKVKSTSEKMSADGIISLYMDYVLENEKEPKTIYKFSKDNGITEDEFYQHFGSFEGLKKDIWKRFFANSVGLLQRSPEFESFTTREKLLTFFYTFFENLTANRSYVLFILSREPEVTKNLEQLKGLRRQVIGFSKDLIRENNEEKSAKFLKQSETVFSEATWIQFLFLLKFWMDDNSARFESTDVAIEKSVNTVFDLFDNTPLERVVDFGKFLWKEKMG